MGVLLFVLSGHLYLIVGQTAERILLVLSVFLLVKECVFYKIRRRAFWEFFHYIFVFCMLIDSLIFAKSMPVIYAGGMFLIWYIAFKIVPQIEMNKKYGLYDWIYKINFGMCLVVIVSSVFSTPIRFSNYRGIFVNPNSFGNFISFFTGIILPILLYKLLLIKTKFRDLITELGILMLCIFFVVISSSRTAFLTVAIQCIAFICIFLAKFFKKKVSKELLNKLLVGLCILCSCLFIVHNFTNFFEILNSAIFSKFSHLTNDQLNNRGDFWLEIWNNSGLFENGEKLIEASHNVYFGLVDQFGKICGFIYFIFIIANCSKTFFRALVADDYKFKYVPLFASITFLCVSMTENYLLTNAMLMMYLFMPLTDEEYCKVIQ